MKAHRRETWSTRSGNMVLKETLIIILGTIHGQYGQSLMAKVTSMTNLVVSNTVLSSGILLLTLGSGACMPTPYSGKTAAQRVRNMNPMCSAGTTKTS